MPARTKRTQGIYHFQFFLEDRNSGTIVTKDISIAELGYEPELWDKMQEADRVFALRSATDDWLLEYIDSGWVAKSGGESHVKD